MPQLCRVPSAAAVGCNDMCAMKLERILSLGKVKGGQADREEEQL